MFIVNKYVMCVFFVLYGMRVFQHPQKYQNSYRARMREEKAMAEIEAQEPGADETQDLDVHQRAQCLLESFRN